MTEPQQASVYIWGDRESHVVDLPQDALVDFMIGRTVVMTPELQVRIQGEFRAMDDYRNAIDNGIQALTSQLLQAAMEAAPSLEHPVCDAEQALWRGIAIGKYEGLTEAATKLSEIQKLAAAGVSGEAQ